MTSEPDDSIHPLWANKKPPEKIKPPPLITGATPLPKNPKSEAVLLEIVSVLPHVNQLLTYNERDLLAEIIKRGVNTFEEDDWLEEIYARTGVFELVWGKKKS